MTQYLALAWAKQAVLGPQNYSFENLNEADLYPAEFPGQCAPA